MTMKDLRQYIDDLRRFLLARYPTMPWPDSMFVVEASRGTLLPDGRLAFSKEDLVPVDEFSRRFEELRSLGHAWINLHYAGLWEDAGVLVIELASTASGASTPSVNVSGPQQRAIDADWDAEQEVEIGG